METTRHFTTKVYVVNDGATALHYHPKLEIYLPPGGHVERDELPHEAGLREAEEETGLDPKLYRDISNVEVPGGRALPEPAYHILYNVNTHSNGEVGHQHIDLIYFANVPSREIDPEEDEVPAEEWGWYTREDLENNNFDPDTVKIATEAIKTVEEKM